MTAEEESKRAVPMSLKALLELDKQLSKQLFEHCDLKYNYPTYLPYLKYLEVSCHGLTWFIGVAALMYFIPSQIVLWVNLLWLLTLDVVVVAVIKAFARRRRPNYSRNAMPLAISVDKFSFPSGHATRSIVLALFFWRVYPVHWLLVWLVLLPWSVSVSLSRVLMARHHLLDVLAGALVAAAEYLVLASTIIGEDTAKNIGAQLFGEDPWSSG